jgi:prepilin-type N-terminal cleavage/methylation domain-containing protein
MPAARSRNNKAFTLIELLITVTIISILSGLLLGVINVRGLRQKSRDSRRIADLEKVQVALEAYLADNRVYPTTASGWISVSDNTASLIDVLEPDYINGFPDDPLFEGGSSFLPCGGSDQYRYNYISDQNRYILTAIMETTTTNDDSPCSDLYNWSNYPSPASSWGNGSCGAGYATEDYCYGVQNP